MMKWEKLTYPNGVPVGEMRENRTKAVFEWIMAGTLPELRKYTITISKTPKISSQKNAENIGC